MKTGLKLIDDVLINGLEKSKVNILETTFANGKTTTMLKVSKNIIESGGNVLFITQGDFPRVLYRKLFKIICQSEDIDKEKVITYMNTLNGSFKIRKVKQEITNTDIINKLNDSDNFDLIILDGILVDGGIDYNLINNSVKPILFFTKCLSTTLLNKNVISNFDVSDNFEILTLHFKSCGNDGKLYDLFHNNSLVGEIILTGLI